MIYQASTRRTYLFQLFVLARHGPRNPPTCETTATPELHDQLRGRVGDGHPRAVGAGDTAVATPPRWTADARSGSDVGAYPIHCTGAADPNYDISHVAGTLTIAPAPLTITADATTTRPPS